ETLDPLLCAIQRLGQPARELHALLVARDRLLERERAALQLLDDGLEPLERFLEAWAFVGRGGRGLSRFRRHCLLPCGRSLSWRPRHRARTRSPPGRPRPASRRRGPAYRPPPARCKSRAPARGAATGHAAGR